MQGEFIPWLSRVLPATIDEDILFHLLSYNLLSILVLQLPLNLVLCTILVLGGSFCKALLFNVIFRCSARCSPQDIFHAIFSYLMLY